MAEKRGYGVGLQTFADMIKRECVYVDKTAYVYKMAHSKGKNFFLSRPRRFGKSLLVTTLQAYFEGRKELFKGLAIEKLETEWTEYPVIHLNLSNGKYYDETSVDDICGGLLRSYEEDYGLPVREDWKLSDRLTKIIKTADKETFDAPTERISDPVPVLFQSGYLTIKGYDREYNTFTLGFPNREVYEGFAKSLYNYYCVEYVGSRDQMNNAFRDLRRKKKTFEEFLESVRRWYAGIPYSITDKNQNEQFYQALFYSLMVGVGADVSAEEQTSDRRMDIALKLPDAIYILEFKYCKTAVGAGPVPARNVGADPMPARKATEQILTKNYAVRFAADQRPVWAVGLNISQDHRTIESYEVVKVKD